MDQQENTGAQAPDTDATTEQATQPEAQPETQAEGQAPTPPPSLLDGGTATPPPVLNVHTASPPDLSKVDLSPMWSVERARALPELALPGGGQNTAFVPFECSDPRAILSFADTDGRTMRVAVTVHGLAKIEVPR